MKIIFINRVNAQSKWGGDLKTISALSSGLQTLGHEAPIISHVSELSPCDFIFINNSLPDLRALKVVIDLMGIPYGIIPYHEDYARHFSASFGFYSYIQSGLDKESDFPLETLIQTPQLIHNYPVTAPYTPYINAPVFEGAKITITGSNEEAKTIHRDFPGCPTKTIHWSPGFAEDFLCQSATDEFLSFTGLKSGEYILQVGRMQLRKNQLASIIATKDGDIPLVFISTTSQSPNYLATCLEAIKKYRKGPTLIISENVSPATWGRLRIIPMPDGKKLSASMLHSAFAHAGLHLHPAFCELPGLTYFESALLGIPTIASTWTTIAEYFESPSFDDRIEYCEPYDLAKITQLIEKKMGQKYTPGPTHPALQRTSVDVAKDFLSCLYLS